MRVLSASAFFVLGAWKNEFLMLCPEILIQICVVKIAKIRFAVQDFQNETLEQKSGPGAKLILSGATIMEVFSHR
jgi:hypothetical protein